MTLIIDMPIAAAIATERLYFMTFPGMAPALTSSYLLFEHGNSRLCGDDEPAQEHGQRWSRYFMAALGKLCAEHRAERREADVDSRQEQHETDIGVDDAYGYPCDLTL